MIRIFRYALCAMLLPLLAACANPNAIGVQDFGSIVGRVYDTKTSQPLNDVIVSVGSLLTVHTGPDGSFALSNVPVGDQTVRVNPPGGYLPPPPAQVTVQKGETATVPAIGLTPTGP